MPELPSGSFSRVTVLGTGLVGGSFALAVRSALPGARIVGWDKPDVLHRAASRGIVDEGIAALPDALAGADLIYIALPVGLTIERLPEIARHAPPEALVTDAASTKREVCAAARACFAPSAHFPVAHFLGGHPMAGSEASGMDAAEATLFRGAKYTLVPLIDAKVAAKSGAASDQREDKFVQLLHGIGAQPMWMDAATHDRAAALVSHLPQLLSLALAGVLREATDEATERAGLPLTMAGRGLRDALRLAGSPYSLWRDIILTNSDNLEVALDRMALAIEQLRENLKQRELEQQFAVANDVYKILRDLQ